MKNVLAVATGVADGMQMGLNARAGLITRGLAEMMRLGAAIGARAETLMGLAGLGDLVLTCTGDLSRNRRLGLALGRGVPLQRAVAEIGQVVESVQTVDTVMQLASRARCRAADHGARATRAARGAVAGRSDACAAFARAEARVSGCRLMVAAMERITPNALTLPSPASGRGAPTSLRSRRTPLSRLRGDEGQRASPLHQTRQHKRPPTRVRLHLNPLEPTSLPANPRCRHASNTITATALERLRLRLPGRIGKRKRCSGGRRIDDRPAEVRASRVRTTAHRRSRT